MTFTKPDSLTRAQRLRANERKPAGQPSSRISEQNPFLVTARPRTPSRRRLAITFGAGGARTLCCALHEARCILQREIDADEEPDVAVRCQIGLQLRSCRRRIERQCLGP